ncbi:MAG TPA: MFS transporter [Candidatus Limnocylindrales bacterium]|nr:MFS transporter [Candidatus Limnocylindrales bacterium]
MSDASARPGPTRWTPALRFVVLVGVMSLFADFTYEGMRSVSGPYLALLGASATAVGVVSGLGELLGYGLRIVSGRLSDRTGQFWPITIAGYVVQMVAVPALALAGSWPAAAGLILLERIGKATRNPPRDVMLSHAGKEIGVGWAFGLHEALDQAGALIGPLVIALVLALRNDYRLAFAWLVVPAAITLLVLAVARLQYPRPEELERHPPDVRTEGLPRTFWLYLAAASLVAAGFADFPIIAFHFQQAAVVSTPAVPFLYAVAMGLSGLASLVFGRLFDRTGIRILVPLTIVTAAYAPLAFLGGPLVAGLGVALWGIGMGVHESIVPAAVALMAPANRRASAYGLFTAAYGIAWFVGSAAMGLLYDVAFPVLIGFAIVAELAAIPLLLRVRALMASAA